VAILDKDPVRAEVLNDLGVIYLLQQRYHECLVALRGALTAKPDFAPALANLGRLYIATQMNFSAVRELEKAVKLEPGNVTNLCDLGEAYQRTLNQAAAERTYRQALKVNPRHTPARVGLGKVLYARTKYDEAERELAQALKESPGDADAQTTLGRMRLERSTSDSDLPNIRSLFEGAAKADPQSPDAWYDLGRIAMRERRHDDAIGFFRRALQISRGHSAAMNQLERALRASGQVKEADRVGATFHRLAMRGREKNRLEERISMSPGDWDSRAKLVKIYLESAEPGLAQLVYRQLREGAPDHPELPALTRAMAGISPMAGATP
jgi:tetratricopeptide (TPR) repeat protein